MANVVVKLEFDPIPQENFNEYVLTIAKGFGWRENVEINGQEVANPITKEEALRKGVMNFLGEIYQSEKAKDADVLRQQIIEAATAATASIGSQLIIE